ncbi:D-alanine--D-alanine ligase [[Haemophilus] ducreyi]|uniref:D-alanine--D-alanine ligase n=2 Tax=Haemophilus ducreyi TaxID=730 RepID=DDL_HAEDU|nr:D-alanine--D-alanine ligase [[Haemophilus] ducreyi]Q7VMY2.1 RecName: Full=D-alanine--D-alanine ligase; AltName: Full=D-Ala-D-Ala ligase; AltName: Full=D-alanylalanine synthetase [[Haemophilus] ducreyi 35000HP]AAP95719.1 D-alanine-D-alanine ligase B [[Haemophilus] ducreyi 35000HP]AKO30778.1 D-alanine--D-alanine ligase [[Haemophilus] ducreyi]AKO32216.1 D-alanine--D-alanine ligase [[Haemophilus] ducreyi]AKO33670.1 D-alanine--D-alanine ligase [[Haemophilus] ducreyi]AKO35117.1 D-alanine--D-alan
MNIKNEKIAVLYGGTSQEREVSLHSGAAVTEALKSLGYNVEGIDTKDIAIEKLKEKGIQRVFNILHGGIGENGVLQGALEQMGIPYTGCGVMASAITLDKFRTKLLWNAVGLPTADMVVVQRGQAIDINQIIAKLSLPVFVKPSSEGSSVGVFKVKTKEELLPAITAALEFDTIVLVEEFLTGAEYSVPVLDGEVLPAVQIIPDGEFYDYHAKYLSDKTQYIVPALTNERQAEVAKIVKAAYDVVGCRGWSRIDVMEDQNQNFRLVEVNTNPGMTSHSIFPKSAATMGISFEKLVERVLELSI